jgi:hypothetical protein
MYGDWHTYYYGDNDYVYGALERLEAFNAFDDNTATNGLRL